MLGFLFFVVSYSLKQIRIVYKRCKSDWSLVCKVEFNRFIGTWLLPQVEMAITKAIENNKVLLKVGAHFQFGDCRNRVAVQLQKNLDRLRCLYGISELFCGIRIQNNNPFSNPKK